MNADPALDPAIRARMLAPRAATAELPGIGGRLRARCEDFVVDEIAAYPPDGRCDRHLMVRVQKRGLSTMAAAKEIARVCDVPLREMGIAGRKDTVALTRQWMSIPFEAAQALLRMRHPSIEVLEVHAHGQKLRTGHLRGNRFEIVVRDLAVDFDEAMRRAQAKLEALRVQGGIENLYGPQRFGRGGANLDRGLQVLGGRRLEHRLVFVASAAQAGLFNLYVALRRENGWLREVLPGDVLRKRDTGGLFYVDDVAVERARFDRGEVEITGPIHGTKMRRPPESTAAALLEDEVLERTGLSHERLRVHGKRLPGSRRALQIDLGPIVCERAEDEEGLGVGLRLCFDLPAGSFATQLTRELQIGPDTSDPLEDLLTDDPDHGMDLQ